MASQSNSSAGTTVNFEYHPDRADPTRIEVSLVFTPGLSDALVSRIVDSRLTNTASATLSTANRSEIPHTATTLGPLREQARQCVIDAVKSHGLDGEVAVGTVEPMDLTATVIRIDARALLAQLERSRNSPSGESGVEPVDLLRRLIEAISNQRA